MNGHLVQWSPSPYCAFLPCCSLCPVCSPPRMCPWLPMLRVTAWGAPVGPPCAAAITHTGRAARAQQAVLQGGKPPTLLIEGLQQAFITSAACREREKNLWPLIGKDLGGEHGGW